MSKLLWIGDAYVQTGFSRVTHNVLAHLSPSWEKVVLGINYNGDPHTYPYDMYPAVNGGDVWGVARVAGLVEKFKPDIVCINNDPWNIVAYLEELVGQRVVAYMPVDAPNQLAGSLLGGLTHAIAYTHFGRKELLLGGYRGSCDVIPHGVDTSMYFPMEKGEARAHLKLSTHVGPDAFIIGNVNRNQPRKRLDLMIQAWTQWWVSVGQPADAYLYLHCSNRDIGVNILQLSKYYGMQKQLIVTNPNMGPSSALPESDMRYVYNAMDVHVNTGMGEGWGLTNHESMACGIPQIVPEYAALAEWAVGAVRYVPCTTFAVTNSNINTIGGVPDVDALVEAFTELYLSRERRAELSVAARNRATEERFSWPVIAKQFGDLLTRVITEVSIGEEVANGQVS